MLRTTPANDNTPAIVREAWRGQLFDDVAAKKAERKRAAAMARAVLAGVLLGVAGSVSFFMV